MGESLRGPVESQVLVKIAPRKNVEGGTQVVYKKIRLELQVKKDDVST